MIPIIAAGLGGILGISGAIAAQLIAWKLRDIGDVLVSVYEMQVIYPEGVNNGGTRTINPAVPAHHPYYKNPDMYQTVTASYSLSFELFNEKDVDTALQNLSIVFYKGGEVMAKGELLRPGATTRELTIGDRVRRKGPSDPGQPRRAEELILDPPTTVELPSRNPVHQILSGEISGESGKRVMQSDRAWLEAHFPNGSRFSKEIGVLAESSEIYGEIWDLKREEPRTRLQRLRYKFQHVSGS